MKTEKKKRKAKVDFEEFQEMLATRYGMLLVKDLEYEQRMRRKAIRLSRKRKPGDYIK